MKDFIKKIQDLPEKKRKILLWTIIAVLGITLFIFYVKNISQRIKSFQGRNIIEELKIPSLKQEIENIPTPEMPTTEELEEMIKESQGQQEQQGQQEGGTESGEQPIN
jgi:type II secretory pathway component PulM